MPNDGRRYRVLGRMLDLWKEVRVRFTGATTGLLRPGNRVTDRNSTMTPEGALQKTIMDWLAAKRVLAFRMNTGAIKTESRFFRFGVPGMADILAFPRQMPVSGMVCEFGKSPQFKRTFVHGNFVMWIEVKTAKGRQSDFQKSFQRQVEEEGHRYILARDLSDVEKAMEG